MSSDLQLALEYFQLADYAASTIVPNNVDDESYKPM